MSESTAYDWILLPNPRSIQRRPGTGSNDKETVTFDRRNTPPGGYRLSITPGGIVFIAHDEAALFHARQTLAQITLQSPRLPCLEIEDSPDFPIRGVMLDISRDKVPTMATLFSLVDLLSSWKINQLQLYTEHTFAYSQHKEVWQNASPMTAEEIRQLDSYCQKRFIELVPNQNSFGHMERWLKHDKYKHLAEVLDGADTPWGFRWKGPFSLCPTDPECIKFLSGLYDELLPNFTSQLFNVGCDETFDIGQGRSRGVPDAYLNFLHRVHDLVQSRGHKMLFWGDIVLDHPELIDRLPKPILALAWGYEADHPFEENAAKFAAAGVPFYVCPGTSSWLSIAGRTDNMLLNQIRSADAGRKHGAIGFLNTDWGDHGHLQYLPISYAGFAAGAALSWCADTNRNINLPAALDLHAFHEPANVLSSPSPRTRGEGWGEGSSRSQTATNLGQLACDLGNVYQTVGKLWPNSSTLFRILVPSSTHRDPMEGITEEGLLAAESAIDRAISPLAAANADPLITNEFANAAALLRTACRIGRSLPVDMHPILTEHRRLWLARNRPGGLEDSIARLSIHSKKE